MKSLIGFIFFVFLISSCTPQEVKKSASCGENELFDEIKRTCVINTTPRLPVATSTSLTILENASENSYPISYTDNDGDLVNSCTITESFTGLRGVIKSQGIIYRGSVTNAAHLYYSISLLNDPSVAVGSEVATLSGSTVVVRMRDGATISDNIVNAINTSPTLITAGITAELVETFRFQTAQASINFQGGFCECTNGTCQVTLQPITYDDGLTYLKYYVTDADGNSDIKTLEVNVTNVDRAPETRDITGLSFNEDSFITVSLTPYAYGGVPTTEAYADPDGDVATTCTISNLHASISQVSACSCFAGNCSVTIMGAANYNEMGIDYFDYTVSSNGNTSNISTVSGDVVSVPDSAVVTSITWNFTESGTNAGAPDTATFSLPIPTDVDTGETYEYYVLAGATLDSNIATTTDCFGDDRTSTTCTLTLNELAQSSQTTTFKYYVKDSNGAFSNSATITLNITATNDAPFFASVADISESGNESSDWNPLSFDVTLVAGQDNENDISGALLNYFLTDIGGNISSSGTGTYGTLSGCMNLSGSDDLQDLVCSYTPNDGNTSGVTDVFYYVVNDGTTNSLVARKINVTIDPVSDIPTICQYSKYSQIKGRTECGITGCIGDDSPKFLPISHTSADPVSYYDKKNGGCYLSSSTTSWERVSNYIKKVSIGEKQTVIIDNIVVNEGGDSAEDGEDVQISQPSANLTVSNSVLTPKANIKFFYDGDNDGKYDNALVDHATGSGATASAITLNQTANDASVGRLRIEITPVSGQVGSSIVTMKINDDQALSTTASFEVEVVPLSVIHNGWAKIKSVGIKTDKFGLPLEKNTTCTYSLDKCNNGSTCLSTSSGSPSASADFTGAVYKTSSGCYISTAPGKNSWSPINSSCAFSSNLCNGGGTCFSSSSGSPSASADIAGAIYQTASGCYRSLSSGSSAWTAIPATKSFCNITEVKRYDANSIAKCSYSLSSCNSGGACVSSDIYADPALPSTVSADSANAIFRDGAGNCFKATAAGTASWTRVSSSSDADLDDSTNTCDTGLGANRSASCASNLSSTTEAALITELDGLLDPTNNKNVYFYNTSSLAQDNQRCWYSDGASWKSYSSTTEISITWEAFQVSGSGTVTGYYVYRRASGETFDYSMPLNKTAIAANVFQYVDNGTNSRVPPAPNRVYTYEVRPIVTDGTNVVEATSNSNLSKVRIISPPNNTVFAHRWMMNKKICGFYPSTTKSPELNYICEYVGFADRKTSTIFTDAGASVEAYPTISSTTETVYDIENDLIINRFEMGCPYTSSGCSTNDGSCIDGRAPIDGSDGIDGDYYYDRSSATCYYKDAGAWAEANTLGTGEGLSGLGQAAYLPPLTRVGQAFATNSCTDITLEDIAGLSPVAPITKILPTKKEQFVYSQWEITSTFTNSIASQYEQGQSLNSQSKCNSSGAHGITYGYTDNQLPDSFTFYSIPGTASSTIRSVYTGSLQTAACVSMFGVQDSIGNVGEWLNSSDSFTYGETADPYYTFTSTFATEDDQAFGGGGTAVSYAFDEGTATGPCNNIDGSGDFSCEGVMAEWQIQDQTYNALKIDMGSGLPITSEFSTTTDTAYPYMLAVNDTSLSFKNDTIDLNMTMTYPDQPALPAEPALGNGETLGIISGGGFFDKEAAGVFKIELDRPTRQRKDVGYRCIARIPYYDYDSN